ncbi:MAG: UDP-3-O-(3-hydroxymyristoyl)glucosamine N-acyltransferase [Pseudomonadota bacterium]
MPGSDPLPLPLSTIHARFRDSTEPLCAGLFEAHHGDDPEVATIAPLETAGPGALVFVAKPEDVTAVLERGVRALVASAEAAEAVAAAPEGGEVGVLVSGNVTLALALVKQAYADPQPLADHLAGVDAGARVADDAELGRDVRVGPFVVIEPGAVIGDGCVIHAHAVIQRGARLGAGCTIHPHAVIGFDCELGAEVIVKSGTVIGSEGFGFAQDAERHSHRIPQSGRVVVGPRTVIGANCVLDRATFGETRVEAGVIMDNFCHIAHNCTIGEDAILTAGFIVAGSTRIGKRVIASGQTGVLDHLNIADDVVLLQRAGVIEDIDEPGYYAGMPARPLAEYQRTVAMQKRLGDMRKKLNALEKRLDAGEGGD